jgi:ATPase subunit of ABC transporter with duplicated ATPase domains
MKVRKTLMIKINNLRFEYSHTPVLSGISFTIGPGDRIGLVGSNGAGKSTLLKLIEGKLVPTDGQIDRTRDIAGFMPQELTPWHDLTCRECIEELTGIRAAYVELETASENMLEDEDAYNTALEKVDSIGAYTLDERLPRALQEVGLTTSFLDKKVGDLSGGQQTKLALASILVAKYDVFLLDEPTNNLDIAGIEILERFIAGSKAGFLIISHDRRFLKETMNKIVDLKPDAGGMEFFGGGYTDWRVAQERERASQARAHREAVNERAKLEDAMQRKMAQSVRTDRAEKDAKDNDKMATDKKNENASKTLAKASKALETRLGRLEDIEKPDEEIDLKLLFPTTDTKPGGDMVKLEKAIAEYEDKELGPYNYTVRGGDRVAVIGPNGEGKSTFVKLLAGLLMPAKGKREVAEATCIGLVEQQPEFDRPDEPLVDNVARMSGADGTKAATELARFGIARESQMLPANRVSPGQRGKAFLAVHALRATNLLIMDEPTNHLDVRAAEALGKALATYPGALVVVSHDREFLDDAKISRFAVIQEGSVLSEKETAEYVKVHHLAREKDKE